MTNLQNSLPPTDQTGQWGILRHPFPILQRKLQFPNTWIDRETLRKLISDQLVSVIPGPIDNVGIKCVLF